MNVRMVWPVSPGMIKASRSHSPGSDYIDIASPVGDIGVRLNHDDQAVTVTLSDQSASRQLRATMARNLGLSLGASVTLEDGAEDPVKANVSLGPATLYLGLRGSYPSAERFGLIRAIVTGLVGSGQRRRTSVSLDYYDPETVEGRELRARANLWNDDNEHRPGESREWSVSLTEALWGKPKHAPDAAIDERDVTIAMPEGTFPMRARLMERRITWPRWPLARLYRWVDFSPACILVPMRRSDEMQYIGSGPGCVEGVTGDSFIAAIGELHRRVARARESYGSRNWVPGPTAHHRDSHHVTLVGASDAGPQKATAADLFHGRSLLVIAGAEGVWLAERDAAWLAEPPWNTPIAVAELARRPSDGGIVINRIDIRWALDVDGAAVLSTTPIWPGSVVRIGVHTIVAHFHPIGPPPPAVQLELVAEPDFAAELALDVAEVASTLDTSVPGPSEVEPPAASALDEPAPPASTKWNGD